MTCPLMPHAARAQGWVPCQADGTLLQRGDSGFNADGSAGLLSSVLPTSTPTGVYGSLFGWWLDAYTPNASDRYGTSFGLRDGLALGSDAYNNADSHGIFDPNNSGSGPDIGGSVTATWHDTLTAHLKWTSYGPAPDPADFLLQTHVSATASPASSGLSSSASSFLGPLSVTATPDGNTASASDRRLLRLKPSGGVVTISLAGGVDTDTGNGLPYRTYGPADAWASAYASGSATPDNRALSLNSSLGQTYHKDQATGTRVPDVRDADGTLNLTTLNSYHSYITSTDPVGNTYNNDDPFINIITFTPNFSGWDYVEWEDPRTGTTSDVPNVVNPDTWSWSPNNSGDYWDTGICQMPWGSISYQDGVAQGQPTGSRTYAVSYTATDNADGATATANANVQLHDQWENKVNDSPATTDNDSYFYLYAGGSKIGIENPAGSSGTETAHWGFTITATATLGLSLTGNIKPSEASLLGIGIQGNASLSIAVGASLGVDSPPIDPGFRRYPYVHLQYKTNHYLVDHYTISGFDTVTKQAADDPSTASTTAGWTAEEPIA